LNRDELKEYLRKKLNKIDTISYSFDAIVCLNANIPDISVFERMSGIPILAADGAAELMLGIGIMPNAIIGDLDSFKNIEGRSDISSEIVKIEDQDTTDFEKCLNYATAKGYRNILILGFHGGDLEHTLNNWSVFMRYGRVLNLCILDRSRYGIALFDSILLETSAEEIISLIPQPYSLLTTENLKWELSGEPLALGVREGARNMAMDESIAISIHDGSIMLFFDERLPNCPVVVKE
jgi:thiamine pyrophosphokinase